MRQEFYYLVLAICDFQFAPRMSPRVSQTWNRINWKSRLIAIDVLLFELGNGALGGLLSQISTWKVLASSPHATTYNRAALKVGSFLLQEGKAKDKRPVNFSQHAPSINASLASVGRFGHRWAKTVYSLFTSWPVWGGLIGVVQQRLLRLSVAWLGSPVGVDEAPRLCMQTAKPQDRSKFFSLLSKWDQLSRDILVDSNSNSIGGQLVSFVSVCIKPLVKLKKLAFD